MHISRHIAQKPLEIRQGSCTAFAQSDGVICTSDLIRASLEKYKYFTKIITHRIMKSNHLIWYNLIVEKPTKEAVAIYRQEILQDIRLFTSQPKAKFYDNLFLNLELPENFCKGNTTGCKGFPKYALLCAFIVMKCEGFSQITGKVKAQLEQLRSTKAAQEAQADAIGAFMFEIQELDILTEFDEKLWLTVIDTVTVHTDGRMRFKFQGGTEIEA